MIRPLGRWLNLLLVKLRKRIKGLTFVLPALAVYTFVVGYPMIMTFFYSFTDWKMGREPKFAGLENYAHMFDSSEWVVWQAVKNNLLWMVLMIVVNLSLALAVSGLLRNVNPKVMKVLRVIFYLPVILPRTVVCRIWMWLYNPIVGLQPVLEKLDLPFLGLGDPDTVMYAIAVVGVWCWWGFPLVILLSSLQQIDPVYYEAASMEGAGRTAQFVKITVPMLRPTLIFILVLTMVTSFQIFDLNYIMTWGGPGKASEVLSTLIYKNGILQFQAGYGSALAVLQMLLSSVGIAAYMYLQRKELETV